jgi:hypothetical protein
MAVNYENSQKNLTVETSLWDELYLQFDFEASILRNDSIPPKVLILQYHQSHLHIYDHQDF